MNYTVNRTPPVPPTVESVTLELTPEEFFLLSALQYCHLGGIHPVRRSLETGLRKAFAETFPGVDRHNAQQRRGESAFLAQVAMRRLPGVAS